MGWGAPEGQRKGRRIGRGRKTHGRVWVGEHLKDRGKGGELEGEGKDGRVWVGEHLKDRGKGGELEGEGKPMAGFGLVST